MTTSIITRRVASPLERDIEKKIGLYAKRHNVEYIKFTSPQRRAVPDRMLICPNGTIGFLEIKRKGQKPTPLQYRELHKLKERLCNVGWCDTTRDGCNFIDLLLQKGDWTKNQIIQGEGLVV